MKRKLLSWAYFVLYYSLYLYVIRVFFLDFQLIEDKKEALIVAGAASLLPLGVFLQKYVKIFVVINIVILVSGMATYQYVWDFMGVHVHKIFSELIALFGDTNILEIKSVLQNMTNKFMLYLILIISSIGFLFFQPEFPYRNKKIIQCGLIVIIVCSSIYVIKNEEFFFKRNYQNFKKNIELIKSSHLAKVEKNQFKWGAYQDIQLSSNEKDVVVVILGETTRGDRFQINGYGRETNPILSTKPIVSFRNAISNAAYTLTSTPYILTRKPVGNNMPVWNEKSLISAYKEAGYTTYYISYLNQAHVGDNAINQIVSEADYYIKRPWNGHDGAGVPIIKEILDKPEQKQLIIYKLIGSHFNYQDRYPASYDKFKPSFTTEKYSSPKVEDKELLDNSYDNSILYTDYVVGSIINDLEKIRGYALLAFISDHGTAIFEDGKSIYGGNTAYNFNIALFYWFNNEYISKRESLIESLAKNIDEPIDSTYFIDTLFDLTCLNTEQRKGRSLIDEPLTVHPRKVYNNGKVFDYDAYFFDEELK